MTFVNCKTYFAKVKQKIRKNWKRKKYLKKKKKSKRKLHDEQMLLESQRIYLRKKERRPCIVTKMTRQKENKVGECPNLWKRVIRLYFGQTISV